MAKGKGKGKKKGKKEKDDAAPVEEPSEFDGMQTEALQQEVKALEAKLEKAQLDRNYVQLERDTVQTFYDITRKEVSDCNLCIQVKDREMEKMEENHRVEVRVYIQKVKHLEYEHRNSLKRVEGEGEAEVTNELTYHQETEIALKQEKRSLNLEICESDLSNEEKIKQIRMQNDKNLSKLKESFDSNLDVLMNKYEMRLEQLRMDLELRRKVEIHEIEERKNLHINDLMKNHEKAFGQIKNYYNDITHDNLKLIQSLKDEVREMKKKAAANQKLMYDIAQENKRLSEPLTVAVKEVEQLRHGLKDYGKDKLSLKNASARLILLNDQFRGLTSEHDGLASDYNRVESERNKLYDTFESMVVAVQRKSDLKNLVLEKKLGNIQEEYQTREVQFKELCRDVDTTMLDSLTRKLDEEISRRNELIKELQYNLAKVEKAHNDMVRTYEDKLREFGIPEEELRLIPPLATTTSSGPSGLVATK